MRINKKAAVAVVTAVTLAGSGVAFAWWTSSGTGDGSASTGASSAFAVTADDIDTDTLTPGGPTQTVGYKVNNPSTGHQHISSVSISVANANGSAWDPAGDCDADDFTVGGAAAGATETLTKDVDLAGGADYTSDVVVAMINKDADQDDCQNVTVPLFFDVS